MFNMEKFSQNVSFFRQEIHIWTSIIATTLSRRELIIWPSGQPWFLRCSHSTLGTDRRICPIWCSAVQIIMKICVSYYIHIISRTFEPYHIHIYFSHIISSRIQYIYWLFGNIMARWWRRQDWQPQRADMEDADRSGWMTKLLHRDTYA
jgi:hypothetical protein